LVHFSACCKSTGMNLHIWRMATPVMLRWVKAQLGMHWAEPELKKIVQVLAEVS
jgi:hypothetical protein